MSEERHLSRNSLTQSGPSLRCISLRCFPWHVSSASSPLVDFHRFTGGQMAARLKSSRAHGRQTGKPRFGIRLCNPAGIAKLGEADSTGLYLAVKLSPANGIPHEKLTNCHKFGCHKSFLSNHVDGDANRKCQSVPRSVRRNSGTAPTSAESLLFLENYRVGKQCEVKSHYGSCQTVKFRCRILFYDFGLAA